VTLEAVNQQIKGKLHSVRAQVKYIGLPRSPRDLYRVGVELETPANIWGIKSPPEDWRQGSVNVAVGTGAIARMPDSQSPVPTQETQDAPSTGTAVRRPVSIGTSELTLEGSTEAGDPVRVLVSTDQILHALEGRLQQAAEKAVALAMSRRLDEAQPAAVRTIENASQLSLENIEERIPSRVGILSRLKASLTNLSERRQKHVEPSFTGAQETVRHFENSVPEIKPVGVDMRSFSERLAAGEIEVRAGGEAHYQVNIDTTKMLNAKVVGSFRVSGGSQNDIAVALVAEDEFENWINGHQANVLFATNRVTRARLNWPITHSGTYVLAFDNRFSLLSPKRIASDIELHYHIQK
jgi:hypothetical protein